MRATWRCDCEGDPGPPAEDAGAMAFRAMIEADTGHRMRTCPWRAFSDPDYVAIQDAYRACADGQGHATPALLLGTDMSPAVWDGLLHLVRLIDRVRAEQESRRRKQEERNGRSNRVRGPSRY